MIMAQIPLCTSFEGDFVVKLVVVEDSDTMDQVAAKTAAHTAGRTVRARPQAVLRVRLQGADWALEREATVRAIGLGAMECIEVYHEEPARAAATPATTTPGQGGTHG
jgi:toluene monooxygenase system protein B